jgi:hypothetical protein
LHEPSVLPCSQSTPVTTTGEKELARFASSTDGHVLLHAAAQIAEGLVEYRVAVPSSFGPRPSAGYYELVQMDRSALDP